MPPRIPLATNLNLPPKHLHRRRLLSTLPPPPYHPPMRRVHRWATLEVYSAPHLGELVSSPYRPRSASRFGLRRPRRFWYRCFVAENLPGEAGGRRERAGIAEAGTKRSRQG